MQRICLVTSTHISYNPRVVKEADALSEAGHDVRVVGVSVEAEKAQLDDELTRSRSWHWEPINARPNSLAGRARWLMAGARQKRFQKSWMKSASPLAAERAYSRYYPELAAAAASERADLFIGHLAGLPSAASAAQRWNAKLGFDAEDFHRGEFTEGQAGDEMMRLTGRMEEKYIPACDYVIAASDGIGRAYSDLLRIPPPETILNVFSRRDRNGHTPPAEIEREREGPELSLYWYSQIIGPDRGLEDALHAMARLRPKARLNVRGKWAAGYEDKFLALARKLGITDHVRALDPVPPEQLVERASRHDVGLALEPGNRPNNQLAVSNKICVYLLAGLAVAASATQGQRDFLERIPGSGFLYPIGDAAVLAERLRTWVERPDLLLAAKKVARNSAEIRFCWEVESKKLVRVIQRVLQRSSVRPD